MRDLTKLLERWLDAGGSRIGQISITRSEDGWELRHIEDRERTDLVLQESPEAARHLANADDSGAFRPLKTARNLAHGWKLSVRTTAELRRALDYFYPAMLGCRASYDEHALPMVPLRETLGRQTGMYRVTQKVSDEDARATIDRFCAGCLKHRLWEIAGPNPEPLKFAENEWPLICHEACNLLVAEIRKVVKGQGTPQPADQPPASH